MLWVLWYYTLNLSKFSEMVNLTNRLCWELVNKGGYIAIWQKPSNNSCYLSREAYTSPPICDKDDDPDNVWYVMTLLVLLNITLLLCLCCIWYSTLLKEECDGLDGVEECDGLDGVDKLFSF